LFAKFRGEQPTLTSGLLMNFSAGALRKFPSGPLNPVALIGRLIYTA